MHKPSYIAALLIVCILSLGISSSPAAAKYIPRIGAETNRDGSAHLIVNGEKAIHLRTSNAHLSPKDRVDIVVERLNTLARSDLDPKKITHRTVGRDVRVMVGDSLLVIATAAEAKAHNVTPARLAETWVHNLRRCLALPPLTTDPKTLTVPLGETRFVAVRSFLASPVQADVKDPSLIAVDAEVKPGSLAVTGTALGQTSITLRSEQYTAVVQVHVKKYAAYQSHGNVNAIVTGHNAPASLIARTANEVARQAISIEPGARLHSMNVQRVNRDLAPGHSMQVDVHVEATGDAYIPAKIVIPVVVENRMIRSDATTSIMYSNHPEQVFGYQLLFASQTIASDSPYRLLYHHQNRMDRRIGFVIDVTNTSESPATLHLIEGISPPILCTVIVGYNAGVDFIENHRKNIGRVIVLPPGTRQAIVTQGVDSPHTASGILEMHQLSGDPLLVRVLTKPENQRVSEDPPGVLLAAGRLDPSRIVMSDHVYPEPVRNLEVTHTVGGRWTFLRIGKEAIRHASMDKVLYGNYGVIYDIQATVENPTDRPVEVEIVLEAAAGPIGGVFLVDGKLVHTKYFVPPTAMRIGTVSVPAGRNRTMSIRTIPLSGSAYPATMIIRPMGTTGAIIDIN